LHIEGKKGALDEIEIKDAFATRGKNNIYIWLP
jgi:hypothetical protein